MGAAAGVGADEHLTAQVAGQLGQGEPGGFDVVGCGVRPGVPGAQQDGQRLAGAFGAVISEDGQRVMAFSELNDHGVLVSGPVP